MSIDLQDLAKRHFGFSPAYPNSLIPKSYLETLENHLAKYPFEDHFTLVKQPRKGYGILTCIEEGCNIEIPLTAIPGRRDGGKQAGIGSLSAFQAHIETHPTHKRSCLRRRAQEAKLEAGSDAKEGPLITRDRPLDALNRVKNSSQTSSRRVSELHVARDATPAIAQIRKRVSDSAFERGRIDNDDDVMPPSKKVKQEQSIPVIPKSPLGASKANTTAATRLYANIEEAREHLQDAVKDFLDTETQFDRLHRKKRKTKADLTRIVKIRAKLEDLRQKKEELKNRIPNFGSPRKVQGHSTLKVIASRAPAPSEHRQMSIFGSKVKTEPQEQDIKPVVAFYRPAAQASSPNPFTTLDTTRPQSVTVRVKQENQVAGPSHPKEEFDDDNDDFYLEPPPPRSSSVSNMDGQSEADLSDEEFEADTSPVRQLSAYEGWMQKKLAEQKVKDYWRDLRNGIKPQPLDDVSDHDEGMRQPSPSAIRRRSVAGPSTNRIAPSSATKRAPAPTTHHPTAPVRAPVKVENPFETKPVASGSNVRLHDAPVHRSTALVLSQPKIESDEEMDVDERAPPTDFFDDSEEEDGHSLDFAAELRAAQQADELMEDIGIHLAPTNDSRDTNGLYYGRGRDLYDGPQAGADDIDKFLIMAGNAEQFDGNASVGDALVKLGLNSHLDLLPGMTVSLMAHQIIGVSWMLEKERGPIKGGCLADDMGLGKTVQMISTIMMNRSTDPKNKSTLIIAPLALLDQWKMEIEMKTNADLKVLIYHGQNRPRKVKDIQQYDVVLTTYSTMAAEWPDYEMQARRNMKTQKQKKREGVNPKDSEDLKEKIKNRQQAAGLLFQVEWYRISLDEGQNIRNRATRSSRAVSELRATYRWVLTGTPIMNSLVDCYGYLRFLKIRPWYDWKEFNKHIALKEKKSPSLAVTRLQAIIKLYQIRRTKESELDGKRLIDLPPKEIEITKLEFTEEERAIYTMVEARSQATFNRFLRAGTVLKNYHQVLVLLLRLRQICSHPCLIQEEVAAFVPREEVDNSKAEVVTEVSRARKLISQEFVDDVKNWLKKRVLQRMEAEKKSADAALEGEDCAICLEIMDDSAVFTQCKHVFCKDCIHGVIENSTGNDNGAACPKCRGAISKQNLFTRSAFEPTEKELRGEVPDDDCLEDEMDIDEKEGDGDNNADTSHGKGISRPRRSSTRRKVRYDEEDEDEEDEDEDMSDFIVESDEDEEEKDARRALKKRLGKKRAHVILSDDEMDTPEESEVLIGKKSKEELANEALDNVSRFLPSTKMKFMMQLVLKSFQKNPDEKILVISQWTSCLSLVSDYLKEKGIVHVKYEGDMDRNKRDQAVRVFMSKDKARIMLMSLKCGGVGLNLTRANRVISLDLAWSRAVESQAWDRVHRLGQTRQVKVDRLVIANTVEDRIIDLQNRKQMLADGSLGEGSGKKMGRLTVGELANLFGLDARGRRLNND